MTTPTPRPFASRTSAAGRARSAPSRRPVANPKAFAALYDAERAYLVGTLMSARLRHTEEGTTPGLDAFDRAVLRHTRGLYGTQPNRVQGVLPLGAIALYRPDEAPGRDLKDRSEIAKLLMDGRHQELSVGTSGPSSETSRWHGWSSCAPNTSRSTGTHCATADRFAAGGYSRSISVRSMSTV